MLENINANLEKIGKAIDYISHPIKILIAIWNGIVNISTPLCLITTIVCLVLYVMGHKKAGKGITLNFALYLIIQAIGEI